MGGVADFLGVFRWRQTAARRLNERIETMTEPTIKDEAKERFSEPLLPIEKKLIG